VIFLYLVGESCDSHLKELSIDQSLNVSYHFQVFDPAEKNYTQSLNCTVVGEADGPLRGVTRLIDGTLITAAESGVVKLWKYVIKL